VSDSVHVQSTGRDKLGNEKSISNTGGRYSEQGKSFVSKNYYEIYNTVANKSRYNSEYDIGGYCLSKTGNDEDFNLCLGIAAKALLETCKKTTEGEMICFGN